MLKHDAKWFKRIMDLCEKNKSADTVIEYCFYRTSIESNGKILPLTRDEVGKLMPVAHNEVKNW
jgi:hypothetical protein